MGSKTVITSLTELNCLRSCSMQVRNVHPVCLCAACDKTWPGEGFQCTECSLVFCAKILPDPKNPCQRYKPVVALPQITFAEEVKNPVDETPAIAAAEAVNNPEV